MNFFLRRLVPLPALGVLLFATGCSWTDDAVTVSVPSPDSRTSGHCRKLHEALPEQLDGLDRSDPEPDSEFTAGWGGSAIILRCGVTQPPKMQEPNPPTTTVDGLGWLIEEPGDGSYRFTSALREAYVEVTISKEHAKQGAGSLVDLGRVVKKTVPEGVAT
ncbi:DUF3515 domain-containing protein [Streptomyces sp. TRM66268-LWL]|uniref:DUF3515 domain-containing protein n=1 Tax=Streptomyces polyasparticus TaxID=2767826 RepID=A0ABR7SB91_9ACTN|nr:DUF3515 domain-containing protein [Streptomyces polyasparticus]MBC9711613.1 DUF3515 domain-containing protein [Streptomyces polyasparticus]